MEVSNQELLESALYYTRKERMLLENLKQLLDDIENDNEDLEIIDLELLNEEEL